MAAKVDYIIQNSASCACNYPESRYSRNMHLFLASGSFDFVAMDIVGPFPRTGKFNQCSHISMDCHSKLTQAFMTSKTTAKHVANVFIDHCFISYNIPMYLLTDNRTRFIGMYIAAVCVLPRAMHLTTTMYYSQTNGEDEQFNKTFLTRTRDYAGKNQKYATPSFSR